MPSTATENAEITKLAGEYYDTCSAKLFNEKTTWIGIKLQSEVWMVSFKIFDFVVNSLISAVRKCSKKAMFFSDLPWVIQKQE